MSTVFGITFAVWLLWAALFCLGLCAAAARPIPKPASLRTRSAHSRRTRRSRFVFELELHPSEQRI